MGRAHRLRGLAYAAVFMALQTHTALPHGICLDGCACAHGCVHELYEEGGVRESSGGGEAFPLLPRAGLCFTISSLRGWYPWKRI